MDLIIFHTYILIVLINYLLKYFKIFTCFISIHFRYQGHGKGNTMMQWALAFGIHNRVNNQLKPIKTIPNYAYEGQRNSYQCKTVNDGMD